MAAAILGWTFSAGIVLFVVVWFLLLVMSLLLPLIAIGMVPR